MENAIVGFQTSNLSCIESKPSYYTHVKFDRFGQILTRAFVLTFSSKRVALLLFDRSACHRFHFVTVFVLGSECETYFRSSG